MHNHQNVIVGGSDNNNDVIFTSPKETADLEKENRLSNIIELYSKGLTQSEIAKKLNVNQSTICRDIQYLQEEAKEKIRKYLDEDVLFEFMRFIVGTNTISRELWEIADSEKSTNKEKCQALSLLDNSYRQRLEILLSGPSSFLNVKNNNSKIKECEEIENDPYKKFSNNLGDMIEEFNKNGLSEIKL